MATGKQIRAARALAGWDAKDLAGHIGMTEMSISNIERGTFHPRVTTMEKITKAFSDVGVIFTDNEGVQRRPEGLEIFEGHERFHDFTDFLYEHIKEYGGDICISAADERLFQKYRREAETHRARMKALVDNNNVRVRILAEESTFKSSYAEFRKSPHKSAVPTSFYAFGKCFALISFSHENPPYVVLHKFSPFAEAFKNLFEDAWERAEPQ